MLIPKRVKRRKQHRGNIKGQAQKGNKVVVHSPEVEHPVAVRYAWSDNPDEANLCNENGLLASPFRTDNWN